jgi:NTE family protein
MRGQALRISFAGLFAASILSVPAAAQSPARPKLGLALGGGAARGIAHIGLLQWLEEHRIPVDFIAGASMGALVGGAYAAGMTPEELRELMRDADWDLIFLADSPFRYKTFRRKEDARQFPAQIELGLKKGLRLPSGLNAGQGVQVMLDRIGSRYPDLETFDDLPTPFRAVATDLDEAIVVVLDRGSLAEAMRATMAIPGVFTPVSRDGRLLVDGGTLDNVPADVTRSMGADIVVAVNVGARTDGFTAPTNFIDVLGSTMDTMMAIGVIKSLEAADIVITPDLRGFPGTDYRRSEELVERGYQAAESVKDQLLPYAGDAETYEAWRRARLAKKRTGTPQIDAVRVEGVPENEAERIREALQRSLVGDETKIEDIEDEVLRLTGTDRYETIRYALPEEDGKTTLYVHITPKTLGPPFLLPALELENIDSNTFALNLRGRVVFYDTLVPSSEIRLDLAVGTRQEASIELYRRLLGTRLFIAPRAYWNRISLNGYDTEGELVADYREKVAGWGLDLGLDLGSRSELRAGYDALDLRTRLRVGEPSLPEAEGANRFASIRWTFDGQTSPVIPSRGIFSRVGLRYYFDSPDIVSSGEKLAGPSDYAQFEARFSRFHRFHERHRIFYGASGGSSFGDDPGYNEFRLGGLLRLGAFHNGEVIGNNYILGLGGFLYQVMRLPDVIGANGYFGAWLEAGSAFDEWSETSHQWNASGGFVLETFLGPLFVGGSVSLTNGDGRFYVNLGPFVR